MSETPIPVLRILAVCLATTLVACERTPPTPVVPTAPPAAPTPATAPPAPTAPIAEAKPEDQAELQPEARAEDWELPGNLGPMTTRLELETRFGKANVHEETFNGPEGDGSYAALVLFPDDASKRLELVQDADNPDAPIRELRVTSADSRWQDGTGLRSGMTLAQLVALNGAPVTFYGLDWDYGGTVQDWHGGKLANAVDALTFHRIGLVVRPGAGDARLPTGDASFRSDDARYPTIGTDLVVGQIGISWPHEGED